MPTITIGNRQYDHHPAGTDAKPALHAIGKRIRTNRLRSIEDGDLGSLRQADLRTANCAHEWSYTGAAYGGDDARWCGEGRSYCARCGADGDA